MKSFIPKTAKLLVFDELCVYTVAQSMKQSFTSGAPCIADFWDVSIRLDIFACCLRLLLIQHDFYHEHHQEVGSSERARSLFQEDKFLKKILRQR